MDDPWFVAVGVALSIAGLVALYKGLAHLYRVLRQRQGYWQEDEIEAYLLPFIQSTITAVYETSEHSLEWFDKVLLAADKQEIARRIYNLLPDTIDVGFMQWYWKDIVTVEKFSEMVQRVFDRGIEWFRYAKDGLLSELRKEMPV